jgi:3-phenylpropionate/cinnamic acid dioxygenase small subunit
VDIQELSDRAEITDLLTRYAHAVDRKDWNLYRTVFTADATIDYTSAGGIASDLETQAKWLEEALAQFPGTQHLIANIDILFLDADTATVEAMFHNPMILSDSSSFVTGGWYHHDLVRTEQGWRSRSLVEESAYFSGMPANLERPE